MTEHASVGGSSTAPGCDCGGTGACPACLREDVSLLTTERNVLLAAHEGRGERIAALERERDRLGWTVDGLMRHRDGCVAKLEAIRAEVELEQRVGTGASLAANVLAILNRDPTP